MPYGGQQAGEETGPRADVENPKRFFLRQTAGDFIEPKPALPAPEFPKPLLDKRRRSLRPIAFDVVLLLFHETAPS